MTVLLSYLKMDPAQRLKDLVAKANDFDVDPKIPASRYLRSSREMERMVKINFISNFFDMNFIVLT